MMLPDWIVSVASWLVVIGGVGAVATVAILAWYMFVQFVIAQRNAMFYADMNAGAKYMLWLVLRKAKRPEADALAWAPPEVEAWARARVDRSLHGFRRKLAELTAKAEDGNQGKE